MPSTDLKPNNSTRPAGMSGRNEEINAVVDEFINLRYELSLWVDEGLIDLGERFEKAIDQLIRLTSAPGNAGQSTPSKQSSKVIPFAK